MAAAGKLSDLAHRLSEDSATLVRTEIELAKAELRERLSLLGVAAGLGVAAAMVALLALFAFVQSAIYGIATTLSLWLSALIVGILLVLIVALLAFLAKRAAEKGAPPVPEQAIAEARATAEQLKEVAR